MFIALVLFINYYYTVDATAKTVDTILSDAPVATTESSDVFYDDLYYISSLQQESTTTEVATTEEVVPSANAIANNEKQKAKEILEQYRQYNIEKYKLVPFSKAKKRYVKCDKLRLRNKPNKSKKSIIGTVKYNKKLKILGKVKDSQFVFYGSIESPIFVSKKYLSKKKQPKKYTWNGQKLSKGVGTVQGPSGKETYYNMNMSGVVSIMRNMGNKDRYWVREDGCKMLGNYIMVAANLSIRPRGSLVPTSLGMGIVCDTGGFALYQPTQLDLAVVW
jgi:hypothetical protein